MTKLPIALIAASIVLVSCQTLIPDPYREALDSGDLTTAGLYLSNEERYGTDVDDRWQELAQAHVARGEQRDLLRAADIYRHIDEASGLETVARRFLKRDGYEAVFYADRIYQELEDTEGRRRCAATYLELGNDHWDRALEVYEELNDDQGQMTVADRYRDAGDLAKALRIYRTLGPAGEIGIRRVAELLEHRGTTSDRSAARGLYEEIGDTDALLEMAAAALREGDDYEALRIYEALGPVGDPGRRAVAQYYERRGDVRSLQRAVGIYRDLNDLDGELSAVLKLPVGRSPMSPTARNALNQLVPRLQRRGIAGSRGLGLVADAFVRGGDLPRALEIYRSMGPDGIEGQREVARKHLEVISDPSYAAAIAIYRGIDDIDGIRGVAQAYLDRNQADRALALYREIGSLQGQRAVAEHLMGRDKLEEALAVYDAMDDIDGKISVAHAYLDRSYPNNQKALELFRSLGNAEGQRAVASSYVEQGLHQRALDIYRELNDEVGVKTVARDLLQTSPPRLSDAIPIYVSLLMDHGLDYDLSLSSSDEDLLRSVIARRPTYEDAVGYLLLSDTFSLLSIADKTRKSGPWLAGVVAGIGARDSDTLNRSISGVLGGYEFYGPDSMPLFWAIEGARRGGSPRVQSRVASVCLRRNILRVDDALELYTLGNDRGGQDNALRQLYALSPEQTRDHLVASGLSDERIERKLGALAVGAGLLPEAAEHFVAGRDRGSVVTVGDLYYQRNDYDNAMRYYESGELSSEDSTRRLAVSFALSDRPDLALRFFRQAGVRDSYAHRRIAAAFIRAGDPARAAEHLQRSGATESLDDLALSACAAIGTTNAWRSYLRAEPAEPARDRAREALQELTDEIARMESVMQEAYSQRATENYGLSNETVTRLLSSLAPVSESRPDVVSLIHSALNLRARNRVDLAATVDGRRQAAEEQEQLEALLRELSGVTAMSTLTECIDRLGQPSSVLGNKVRWHIDHVEVGITFSIGRAQEVMVGEHLTYSLYRPFTTDAVTRL